MGRLRLTELPALFWVLLAGRESRAQLRFILACRRETARERRRSLIAAAIGDMEQELFGKIRRELPPAMPLPRARKRADPEAMAAEIMRNWYGQEAAPFPGHEMLLTATGTVRVKLPFTVGGPVEPHEVLWVEGRGRVCLTCDR